MRSRTNSLRVALGIVLVLTMTISVALDVSQLFPRLLPVTGEWRQITSLESAAAAGQTAAQLKLRSVSPLARSVLTKAPAKPAASQGSGEPASAAASLPDIASERRYMSPLSGEDVSALAMPEGMSVDEPTVPSETPEPAAPDIPSRLVIPAIELDAPILPAKISLQKVRGEEFTQWQAPNKFAAGWHEDTALLGQPGNTVMSGHHNIHGKVFERLVDLKPGDLIVVFGTKSTFIYQVTNTMILPEKYQELDIRLDNARWILPSDDERLTLVTCWPEKSNTHRLVIVAKPLGDQ